MPLVNNNNAVVEMVMNRNLKSVSTRKHPIHEGMYKKVSAAFESSLGEGRRKSVVGGSLVCSCVSAKMCPAMHSNEFCSSPSNQDYTSLLLYGSVCTSSMSNRLVHGCSCWSTSYVLRWALLAAHAHPNIAKVD